MKTHGILSKQDMINLLATSVAFDLLQNALDFIPAVGWVINIGVDIVAWIVFFFMLRKRGIYLNSFTKIAAFNSGFLLNLFPFISFFGWTLDMLAIIAISRSEARPEDAKLPE